MTRAGTFILVVLCGCISSLSAQEDIHFQGGGGGQLILPTADFGGTTLDYYAGTKYGYAVGAGGHGKVRFGVGGIRLAGEMDFTFLFGHGEAEPGKGTIDLVGRMFNLKVGPEFQFAAPSLPFTPYAGANLAINDLGGDVTFTGVPRVPDGTHITSTAARLGFGLNAGALIPIAPTIALDLGLSYNLINPFAKSWEDPNPSVDQRTDSYLAVNDGSDPLFASGNDKHFISHPRSIQTFAFAVSVIFGPR